MPEQKPPDLHLIAAALRQRLAPTPGCERGPSLRTLAGELGYDAGSGSALISRALSERAGVVSATRLAELSQRLGLPATTDEATDQTEPPGRRSASATEGSPRSGTTEGSPRRGLPPWLVAATANLRRLAQQARSRR